MTRKSDFATVEERHSFPIEVEDETGERSTVLIGMTAQTTEDSPESVRFDRDGLAYVQKPEGSLLVHVRAPRYDLDQGEAVTVKVAEPVESYFPVLVYDQDDLGGEPVGQAQVRYLSYSAGGERRILVDAHGNLYGARPDSEPGVIAIEDPAELKNVQTKKPTKKTPTKKTRH